MELRAELKAAKEAAVVTTKADGDLIGRRHGRGKRGHGPQSCGAPTSGG